MFPFCPFLAPSLYLRNFPVGHRPTFAHSHALMQPPPPQASHRSWSRRLSQVLLDSLPLRASPCASATHTEDSGHAQQQQRMAGVVALSSPERGGGEGFVGCGSSPQVTLVLPAGAQAAAAVEPGGGRRPQLAAQPAVSRELGYWTACGRHHSSVKCTPAERCHQPCLTAWPSTCLA